RVLQVVEAEVRDAGAREGGLEDADVPLLRIDGPGAALVREHPLAPAAGGERPQRAGEVAVHRHPVNLEALRAALARPAPDGRGIEAHVLGPLELEDVPATGTGVNGGQDLRPVHV